MLALTPLGLSSCGTYLSSAVMPGVQLASHPRAVVVCRPQDDAGICTLIVRELQAHGWSAVAGTLGDKRDTADVLVLYEDHWTWDITMYLLTLRIEMRDPQTNLLLATGRVYGSSNATLIGLPFSTRARSTPETMVQQATGAIFATGHQ